MARFPGGDAQSFADDRYVLSQVGLFDDATGPNGREDFFFRHHLRSVLDQDKQGFDCLASEMQRFIAPIEEFAYRVEAKLTEFVDFPVLQRVRLSLRNNL